MAEQAFAAIEVGTQLYSIAKELPQDIKTWSVNKKLLPGRLQSFAERLTLVDTHLRRFHQYLHNANGVSANQFQRYNTLFKVEQCIAELNEISTIISKLEKEAGKSTFFLRPIIRQLDEVTPKYEELLKKISELTNDVESISTIHENTVVTAPSVSPDYYFDLNTDNRDNPITKVLDNILNAKNHPIGAVLVGAGGMGKTTAICHIAREVKIKMQFQDGILFTELGDESSEQDVISKVARLVGRFVSLEVFHEIEGASSIKEAVTTASVAFEDKRCMIVFDDVWAERIKSVDIVAALSKLVTCDGTKIVFTTRDTKYLAHPLTSKVAVSLDKRGREESERMLVKSAGLEKPSFEEGLNPFNRILDDADGMPLALSLAGNTIKQISLDREENDRQYAWSDYGSNKSQACNQQITHGIILQHISVSIMRSISFIQRQTENIKYMDFFCALSVFQKAERMPYNVLCRAFGEPNSSSIEIVETFKKYGIVGVKRGEEAGSTLYVTIHDLVLDFARSLVGDGEEMKNLLMKWLFSFGDRGQDIGTETELRIPVRKLEHMKNVLMEWAFSFGYGVRENSSGTESHRVASSFKSWWPETEDDEDNYLYRNVIRILKRACMFEEMFWLINEPWWIAKQLKVNGLQQTRTDLDMASQCVGKITEMEQIKRETMERWIRLLNAAITTSYEYVSECEWDGMVYTQLYGRLQYYGEADSVVRTFLEKVKHFAPRPFLLPRLGSLPTVTSQLLDKYKFNGHVLCSKHINNCVHTIYVIDDEFTPIPTRSEDKEIEEYFRCVLMLQVNDLSTGTIATEEIARTNYDLRWKGALSDSGQIICVATWEGEIILLEKQLELGGKEAESVSQGETNEATKTLNELSNRKAFSRLFKKYPKKIRFAGGVESNKNPKPSQDNSQIIKTSREGQWMYAVLHGHEDHVESIAISADGTRIVSGSEDCTVRVWHVKNGEWQSDVLRGHENVVDAVALSADGTCIVSGSYDNTVRVWQVKKNEWKSHALLGHDNLVSSVAISSDGTRIVSGSHDHTVQVWEIKNDEWRSDALHGHENSVMSLTISLDSSRIVSGSQDNTVRVWQVENEKWQSIALRGHEDSVRSVAISTENARIVSGSNDKTVRVWRGENKDWKSATFHGHDDCVMSMAASADGTRIVSGSEDATVRVWQVENGEWHSDPMCGHESEVNSVGISADGTCIVSGSEDCTVRVWQVKNGGWQSDVLHGHEHPVWRVAISADGSCIASGSENYTVRVWQVKDGEWQSTELRGHEDSLSSIAISADGSRIVSGSDDRTVRVWQVKDNEWKSTVLCGHNHSVLSVAISADGTRIVSGSHDDTVRVWELRIDEWCLSKTISLCDSAWFVSLSHNSGLIEIYVLRNGTRWWEFSSGSWRECQDPAKVFFQGGLSSRSQHAFDGSVFHARLSSAHLQALDVVRMDTDVEEIRRTFDGFAVRRQRWPYFGFITIVE